MSATDNTINHRAERLALQRWIRDELAGKNPPPEPLRLPDELAVTDWPPPLRIIESPAPGA